MSKTLTPILENKSLAMTMSFVDAMRKIIEGRRVRRISWGNTDYCFMDNGWLSIYTNDKVNQWIVSDGDMEGQDWIVITEIN